MMSPDLAKEGGCCAGDMVCCVLLLISSLMGVVPVLVCFLCSVVVVSIFRSPARI